MKRNNIRGRLDEPNESTNEFFRIRRSNKSGFSLVTITSLGAVSMMWLFAATAALLPTYQRSAEAKYYTVIRSAAESAVDYTIGEMNTAATGGDPTLSSFPSKVSIPSSVSNVINGNSSATVAVAVNKVLPPSYSSIYPALSAWDGGAAPTSASKASTALLTDGTALQDNYRVVEATASYAGIDRKLRVIVQRAATVSTGGGGGGGGSSSGTTATFFNYSAFGNSRVTFRGGNTKSGGIVSHGYNSSTKTAIPNAGDVFSNGKIYLRGKYSGVDGNLSVALPNTTTERVVRASKNAYVNGNVYSMGEVTPRLIANQANGSVSPSNANVFNKDSSGVPHQAAINDNTFYNANPGDATLPTVQQLPQAPSAPSDAFDLGDIAVGQGDSFTFEPSNSVSKVTVTTSSSKGGSKVTTVVKYPPGTTFKASSVTVQNNGTMAISNNKSGLTDPTVKLYIEGNSSGKFAVNIHGSNGVSNQSQVPGNFQLWYNGTKIVRIAQNPDFHGVVYAPNARVRLNSKGSKGDFYGSFVGNVVNARGKGDIYFDTRLADPSDPGQKSWSLTYNTKTVAGKTVAVVGTPTYKAISWQEVKAP